MEHMGNIFHPLSFSFVLLVERQFYAITLCMRYVKLSKCALCMLYDSYVDELSYYYISLKGVVICTFWIDGMNRVNYGSKDICEKRFAKIFLIGEIKTMVASTLIYYGYKVAWKGRSMVWASHAHWSKNATFLPI